MNMERWIIPCNIKYYDVENAFARLKCLNWKQSNKSIEVGDEIYIYVGAPISAIKYKCRVNKINLCGVEIDDSEFILNGEPYEAYGNHMELELLKTFNGTDYALAELRNKGLRGNIQGPRRAKGIVND